MSRNIKDSLAAEYGAIMDSRAICKILFYPSQAALNAAKKRGRLPFTAVSIEGRPGIYARTEEIAGIIQRSLDASMSAASNEPISAIEQCLEK